MTKEVSFTFDTNVLIKNQDDLATFVKKLEVRKLNYSVSTVTLREIKPGSISEQFLSGMIAISETTIWGETPWGVGRWGGASKELLVLGESPLGKSRLGSEKSVDTLEFILQTISSNSFPSKQNRASLTRGQKNQLRDALILESHCNDGREIFVTGDRKAFIGSDREKRKILEKTLNIKILDLKEFEEFLKTTTTQVAGT
ncbi:MAG: hypothetical protein J0L93_03345 [Deltaproteobacteria bacterium]|nr:hypothetical protein [Deltaproteobacteria bacterium]